MPSMTEPFGYMLQLLREGPDFTLYCGRQHGNPSPVLALALTAEQPSPASLRRLEHEYSLAAELESTWAARPLALTRHEGRTILILKDPGGEPLDLILERDRGQPLDLMRFLRIAIGLATALGQVHQHGLIHKDIKPANILADDAGNVWLTGFGIASQLPRERQAPAPPEIIAGTLPYMAPEQTGRMNRTIDARSDLYSLGVTLYQMLTGALPFDAADPLEWVHCHIAHQPTPPGDRAEVPEPLSAIVMKLLAKNAEERYQTACGLEADLRQCLGDWQSRGCINTFLLGAHDGSDRLLIPEKLYGREREVETLLAAFDRVVAQGTPELVLVSGYSGVGKSSVVNELHKVLGPPRGLFAAGKFDQYKRDIPYATLAQAFQTLIRQILVKSEGEVDQWRGALAEAVGPNGQLIVNLIPEVEFLIGRQPPVPGLPSQEAQNRFQLVFRRFLAAFARPEHPLALFLDDLQWLDAATLELLERLITDPDVRHLMLVGAYRDNEVSSSHPLMRTLDAIRKAGARMQEIVLAPLALDDTGRLIADSLRCEPERARPLAELVQEKTGGNPFFAIQFLTALADEGLLAFDSVALAWQWDIDRIRAKNYTDNVVDLMAAKLKRFSTTTQEALKQLACLGNVVDIATLTLVLRETDEAIDAALLEAVHAGLVFQHGNAYKFLHDRIQQAAYSLILDEHRADIHLRIGRVLLASLTADQLAEHLFDVANQLNRGAGRLIDRDEKAKVATIDLHAGRKAKASAAYASARAYFSAGMELLDETDWGSQYELTFSLGLERAECELLSGNFDTAERIIVELLQRGASKVNQAAVYHLKVQLHEVKGEYPQAVASALACLNLFGIDLPAHPTQEQVQAEYETVWQTLNGRPIESLIELPLMTDRELQAAMQVLSTLLGPAYFTDLHLFCLLVCRMLNVSKQHGTCGASAHGCAYLGALLGPVFHRYGEGYRFVKLACDLVEKHGFIAYQAKAYHSMGLVALWTQPITTAIDFNRATFRTAIETGDLTSACYGMFQSVTILLLRNDPLDAVWRASEMALDFARGAKYGDAADIIRSQQRFIATMQGRTATFSTFSDAQFDEATFEAQLTTDRMPLMVSFYWILKLKARFLSGKYAEALAIADKAKPLLWASAAQIQLLDYFSYTALAVAALYENASADEQSGWRDLLTAHREQLGEWAENYPPTFADKHALVLAEIARLEGRAFDAMQLYEQAIQSAHENGFVQNEALAHELAAQFCLAHGLETSGHTHLRNARNCYDRWGAFVKVKQLDERYPRLHEERLPTSATATIVTPVGQLDVETVVKASQALSSEMVLNKLIERLMRIAVEHSGAERGVLVLLRGDEPWIEAEAATRHGGVEVGVRQTAITSSDLPQSALHYVIRTQERVVLDDASIGNLDSEDEYVRQKRPRSVLCLPIVKQTKLVGALYLENNLTPCAFTSDRVAVLELLASQAAIALENASLYSDLQRSYSDLHRSEAFLAQGQSISHTGSFGFNVSSGEIFWSDETYNIFGHDREVKPTLEFLLQRIHPDDRDLVQQAFDRASEARAALDFEHRLLMPDGRVKHLHVIARLSDTSSGNLEFVGAVTDVTAAKQAEEELRQSESHLAEAQRLAHVGSWIWRVAGRDALHLSEEWYRIYGFDPENGPPAFEERLQRTHPEDRAKWQGAIDRAVAEKSDYEVEFRILLLDGSVKHIHTVGHPVLNTSGDLVQFVGTATDITAAKQAEEKIRQSQRELRQILDLTPQHIFEFGPDGGRLYVNQAALDYYGLTLEDWQSADWSRLFHLHDAERLTREGAGHLRSGTSFEIEVRLRRRDGQHRWFFLRFKPMLDEQGRVTRWYAAGTDIQDRKQAEQRLQNENVALREEIDKASMFEEIVGNSAALKAVLSRISKVAPADSSVLITGETGTGKELVARAIHRRSRRSSRAFVSVNCAAIPRDLIGSELFGHEKGAFTGATQRRLGRFELAEGGTIFLDEVGELPAETQIALLRVLQEHEFERVGGTGLIRTDVRVIAATNRDLEAAIAAGMFRSDLFYRLNVFPIEMPPLRERREDIPLLVEYFIDRFARKAGKSFHAVNKKSLNLLQSYPWPGNIRELQNVIERSAIVCDTENFSVDESWLSRQSPSTEPNREIGLFKRLPSQEKTIIEAALSESGGRVYGPSGAAAKLGMPRSTLEHKIRSLKINKIRFKTSDPSKNS
jgi:PAS domain S-box-containing protein